MNFRRTLLFAAAMPLPAVAQTVPTVPDDIVVTGRGLAARPGDRVVRRRHDRPRRGSPQNAAQPAGKRARRRRRAAAVPPLRLALGQPDQPGHLAARDRRQCVEPRAADPRRRAAGRSVRRLGRRSPPMPPTGIGLIRVTRGGGSGYFGPGRARRHGRARERDARPTSPRFAGRARLWQPRRRSTRRRSARWSAARGFATLSARLCARRRLRADRRRRAAGRADRPAPYEQASGAVRGGGRASAPTPSCRPTSPPSPTGASAAPPSPPTAARAPTPACGWSGAGAGAGRRSPISRPAPSRRSFASVDAARTRRDPDARPVQHARDRARRAARDRAAARRRPSTCALGADVRATSRAGRRSSSPSSPPRRPAGASRAARRGPTGLFADGSVEAGRGRR